MQAPSSIAPAPAGPEQPGPGWRYRAGVAVRVLAAILPAARVEAALTATMAALAIYPCAAMWCFGARIASRAAAGLLVAAAPADAIVLLAKDAA